VDQALGASQYDTEEVEGGLRAGGETTKCVKKGSRIRGFKV